MSEVQIAIIDQEDTQITLAVPGVQGPAGAISSGGSANQVFYKVSGTNYDAGWTFIGNANVDAAAAIAGTKISPNFGSQAIVTTGTNTAASFIPTSSSIPSNGIYLPGANQVAVATNGVARVFVNNTGLGVGITPSRSIDVYRGDAGQAILRLSDADSRNVELRSPDGLGNTAGVGTVTNHDFIGFTGNTERLRLTSTGTLNFKGAGTAGSTQAVSFDGSAPVNSMVLDSSGRLGIGTSSVDSLLHVESASTPTITLEQTGYKAEFRAAGNDLEIRCDEGNTGGQLEFYVGGGTTGTGQKMTILPSGRVGIGTTSPGYPLSVKSATDGGQAIFDLDNQDAGNYGGLRVHLGKTDRECRLEATYDSSFFTFYTAATKKVEIDSSGRLLVGTSNVDGLATNASPVVAGLFKSTSGSAALEHNTTTTLFTAQNESATYIFTVLRSAVGNASGYNAVSLISSNSTVGGSASLVASALKTAANITISVSGATVQAIQTSGGAANLQWTLTRVA